MFHSITNGLNLEDLFTLKNSVRRSIGISLHTLQGPLLYGFVPGYQMSISPFNSDIAMAKVLTYKCGMLYPL